MSSTRNRAIAFLLCLLLSLITFPPQISLAGRGKDVYWVFFSDKGIASPEELAVRLQTQRSSLTPQALERRSKLRGEDLVGWTDLPVHEAYVRQVVSCGATLRVRSKWLNAVSVEASPEAISEIKALAFVTGVRLFSGEPGFRVCPDRVELLDDGSDGAADNEYGVSYRQLHQIQVTEMHAAGYRGEGVLIAMLDTGFLLEHRALQDVNVVAQWDFVQGDSIVRDQANDPPSQHMHGSLTVSTIAAYDPGGYVGAAPKASFLLAKTEILDSEIPDEEDYWVAGIEWAESLGADIVNSSLSYIDWYNYEDLDGRTAVTTIAADIATLNGVVVVASAGNWGNEAWKHMGAPADGKHVIAVGAVDPYGARAYFSSQGPTFDGRIKPDVCARGYVVFVVPPEDTPLYNWMGNGTSYSAPLVTGACALLLEAHPDWTPFDVRDALRSTASQAFNPDNMLGWGTIRTFDACRTITSVPFPKFTSETDLTLVVSPNPSAGETHIFFSAGLPSLYRMGLPVSLRVYDARGRLVRILSTGARGRSPRGVVVWDGRDEQGRSVASGVYFVQGRMGYRSVVEKLVVLR